MLKLNDVQIPSFVKVNKVTYSILPEIVNNTLAVRGRRGVFLFGQEVTDRQISADITIMGVDSADVQSKVRLFASWLYHKEPVKLVNLDEPDKYYMVIPDGSTDIEEAFRVGTSTISFICTEVDAYGDSKFANFSPAANSVFKVPVGGTAETFPVIDITVSKADDSIALVHDSGFVQVGEEADVTKVPTNATPTIFNDHLTYLEGWTSGSYVDGGIISGTMTTVNGYGVEQEGKDYGTYADGWHGAAVVKALSKQLQDFEVTAWLTHKESNVNQVGRVEIYLRNVNGEHIGKFAVVDNSNKANTPKLEARAGDWQEGHYFGNHHGPKTNSLANFYGYIKFSRKGKKWSAAIYKSVNNKNTCIVSKTWTDTGGKFMDKLASIQMHVGAYKAQAVTNRLEISRIMVKEYVELSSTQTPNIVEAGDIITIDCESAKVYKNGEEFYEGLNPSSTFFSLKPGDNGLAVNTSGTQVKVSFTERWL